MKNLVNLQKHHYSPKGLCKTKPNGVHLTVFPFYCVPETVLGIFVSVAEIRVFEISKMFYPPKGAAKQNPYGVHLSILCFIRLVPGTVLERPISPSETKLSKCFIAWMDGWVDGWMGGWMDGWVDGL